MADALHNCLERRLEERPEVRIMLTRQGPPVFKLSPDKIDEITNEVIASINGRLFATPDRTLSGNIFLTDAGLNAVLYPGDGTLPGMRVTLQPPLTPEEWGAHWIMAALHIKDRIEEKGRKHYDLPSIAVVDVSRLGEAGRQPPGPWTCKFQEVLNCCDLGKLQGVLVARSTLIAQLVEPLAWRGTETAALAAGAVFLGEHLPGAA